MNDMTIVLATLTQGGPNIQTCAWSNERQMDFPTQYNDEEGCHVQERLTSTNTDTDIHFFPNFPPPFLVSTSLFLRKLEEDNICL
jgi:hypothetical protein